MNYYRRCGGADCSASPPVCVKRDGKISSTSLSTIREAPKLYTGQSERHNGRTWWEYLCEWNWFVFFTSHGDSFIIELCPLQSSVHPNPINWSRANVICWPKRPGEIETINQKLSWRSRSVRKKPFLLVSVSLWWWFFYFFASPTAAVVAPFELCCWSPNMLKPSSYRFIH